MTALAASTARPLLAVIGASLFASAPAVHAQIAPGHRFFPAQALRGELVVGVAPEATLNGRPARLAPGGRIRDAADMLAMSGALTGQKLVVHYTRDINGLIMDVWILRPVELANRPWPVTPEEAARWSFNPATQTWSKP